MDVFVETICVNFIFGADKFNKAIHKSYLKARYFLSNRLDSLVFPFYCRSIVLLLIKEICYGQRIGLSSALEFCSTSLVNKTYLFIILPGDR